MTREFASAKFSFSTSARQPETPIKSARLTFCVEAIIPLKLLPGLPPSFRIRFNHRIALANEKDWLVTGAKGPLIVGLRPRIFAVETIVARMLRGSFIAIETTALSETRDLSDIVRRRATRKKKFRYPTTRCLYIHQCILFTTLAARDIN